MKAILIWISFLILGAFELHAGNLYLLDETHYHVGKSLDYFEDKEHAYSIQTIEHAEFKPVEKAIPGFGFTDSVYWFRLSLVHNTVSRYQSWWLLVEYPLLEKISFYQMKEGENSPILEDIQGRLLPPSSRQLFQRQFAFSIMPTDRTTTLYLRVETASSMQVPIQLMTSQYFFETSQKMQLLFGLYYGIFVIILLYNIIMRLYTGDNDYLRYILFLLTYIGWQLTLDGFGAQYIWGNWNWMLSYGTGFWISLGTLASIVFSRYFLRTARYAPVWDKVLLGLMGVLILLVIFSMVVDYARIAKITAVVGAVVPVIQWVIGILIWRRGFRAARFYVLGWTAFLAGTVLLALNKLNFIEGFYFLNYAQQIGSAFQMIFISWALVDRVKLLQDEYVDKLNSLNILLQKKVDDALKTARNKDRIMLQQSRLAAMGEMIEQIAHQWRQPLNTMALLNQNHYIKHELEKLTDEDYTRLHDQLNDNLQYMSQTIDDFRSMHSYSHDEEKFTIEEAVDKAVALNEASFRYSNISCKVDTPYPHYITSHRSELIQVIMNLFKNARDAIMEQEVKNGYIYVRIFDDDSHHIIEIEDNGGGIDEQHIDSIFKPYFTTKPEGKGSGIGLFMSKTIIEEHLHGTLDVKNSSYGALFTLKLQKK